MPHKERMWEEMENMSPGQETKIDEKADTSRND
jgi:hypothetical protein